MTKACKAKRRAGRWQLGFSARLVAAVVLGASGMSLALAETNEAPRGDIAVAVNARVPRQVLNNEQFRGRQVNGARVACDRGAAPAQDMPELGAAAQQAEHLISTGASPLTARVQALNWIEQQGGLLETDPESGGLVVWLMNNPQLQDLTPLAALPEIAGLHVSSEKEFDLSPLVGLRELRTLELSNCPELREVTALAGLTNLRELSIRNCLYLSNLECLAGLESLEQLTVQYTNLEDLSPLMSLSNLRVLHIYGCYEITDVSPLLVLDKLETVSFVSCWGLEDATVLEGLPNLEVLITRFEGC